MDAITDFYIGVVDRDGKEIDYLGYCRQRIILTAPYFDGSRLVLTNANEIGFPIVTVPANKNLSVAGVCICTEPTGGVIVKRGSLSNGLEHLKDGQILVIYPGSIKIKIT